MSWQTLQQRTSNFLFGKQRDPFEPGAFKSVALIAFLAWVGLGADGLSSSCYGPEQAFLVLGRQHNHLAIYLAFATAITVFIISLGYNQVIELFPSGGGGYKVATTLLGPYLGLISGVALIIDYVLTIAISIASGTDALFSLFTTHLLAYKEYIEFALIGLLILFNLRGMKESVVVLLPIFIGFLITHVVIIIYGIAAHHAGINHVFVEAAKQTHSMAGIYGWFAVIALLLHSYSLGSGTYTGLEAVSNNVNRLAEPQVRTGKVTMLYMAISLSFMAGGIILLYLLWHAHHVFGQTLNAVVFESILGPTPLGHALLVIILCFEAGILLVAANTGFLAGPAVLANLSVDQWLPRRFQHLSTRLVMHNGIFLFGVGAVIILLWTHAKVSQLVILYSINVFLTFTLTLLGLCVYWIKQRKQQQKQWRQRLAFSALGFLITFGILIVVTLSKFTQEGWVTLLITGLVVGVCLLIKRHYVHITKTLRQLNKQLAPPLEQEEYPQIAFDSNKRTAAFFVGKEKSTAMHTLLWALRMFPQQFHNLIFISVGEVDIKSFRGEDQLNAMRERVEDNLNYFVRYARKYQYAAKAMSSYGPNTVEQLTQLTQEVADEFPNTIFFSTKLIFEKEKWYTRVLHNDTPNALQRRLHNMGQQLIILPMKING